MYYINLTLITIFAGFGFYPNLLASEASPKKYALAHVQTFFKADNPNFLRCCKYLGYLEVCRLARVQCFDDAQRKLEMPMTYKRWSERFYEILRQTRRTDGDWVAEFRQCTDDLCDMLTWTRTPCLNLNRINQGYKDLPEDKRLWHWASAIRTNENFTSLCNGINSLYDFNHKFEIEYANEVERQLYLKGVDELLAAMKASRPMIFSYAMDTILTYPTFQCELELCSDIVPHTMEHIQVPSNDVAFEHAATNWLSMRCDKSSAVSRLLLLYSSLYKKIPAIHRILTQQPTGRCLSELDEIFNTGLIGIVRGRLPQVLGQQPKYDAKTKIWPLHVAQLTTALQALICLAESNNRFLDRDKLVKMQYPILYEIVKAEAAGKEEEKKEEAAS